MLRGKQKFKLRFVQLSSWTILFFATAFLLVGCAAERYTISTTIQEAKAAFLEAKSHGAETKAPFQYYSAELFLDHASDLMKRGKTDTAAFLSHRALSYSREALYLSQIFSPAKK